MKPIYLRQHLLLLLLACSTIAPAAEKLDWDGLLPSLDGVEDPYEKLPLKHRRDANFLWNARKARNEGKTAATPQRLEETYIARLAVSGIDADELMAKMDAFNDFRKANRTRLNTALEGKRISIAGYLLPIEYSGDKIVEFLLVPTVGACIHVPAPPANQMVHVRLQQGMADPGLFAPVQVTGLISIGYSTQSVTYSDGQLAVKTGYSMDAAEVELYEG